ncbi:MAG: C10 family peptidase [Bacteroidota bacterium]
MIKTSIIKKLSFFFVLLLFISCSKDNQIENKEILVNDHFVGLAEIEAIAGGIEFPDGNDLNLKSTGSQTKSLSSIDEIKNTSGETLLYIINYDEGGFLILSSDKRSIPVLAYSTENNFRVDENSHSPSLRLWMDDARKQMEDIRSSSSEQSRISENAWESIQTALISEVSSLKKEPIPDCYEHTDIFTEGPFTVPTWHQDSPFNDDLITQTCGGETDPIKAGCVTIALAEIMRYHEHPTSYSWTSMPYTSGNSTTAAFIEDIYDEADAFPGSSIVYDCDWGTAVTLSDVGVFLENEFGYSSAEYLDPINHSTIKNNILYDRPVYMAGNDPVNGGHAWVVNGYREYIYYDDDCNSWSSIHYHCVWGWAATSENGFYKFGYFNPDKPSGGNYSFNSSIEVVANIIP